MELGNTSLPFHNITMTQRVGINVYIHYTFLPMGLSIQQRHLDMKKEYFLLFSNHVHDMASRVYRHNN